MYPTGKLKAAALSSSKPVVESTISRAGLLPLCENIHEQQPEADGLKLHQEGRANKRGWDVFQQEKG
jgi:hypothetical protein